MPCPGCPFGLPRLPVISSRSFVLAQMKTFPATDLKQNTGDVLDAANREPVAITRHGKPRYVLMSIDAYNARFPNDLKRAIAIEEMPDDHLRMIEKAVAELNLMPKQHERGETTARKIARWGHD